MPPSSSPLERSPLPSIAIVGNDALLAAAPATPIQLAHACRVSGFDVVVPASWGDELIAAEVLRQLPSRDEEPAVLCACPHVASRLLASGGDLAPFLMSLVAPPVAAARYLRALYAGHGIRITYIGECPAADDVAIDSRLSPKEFLATLARRDIVLAAQPLVFDSVVPPDRRRWCSLPGGLPLPELVASECPGRTVVDIRTGDFSSELAQYLIAGESVLIDLAPRLACPCSGVAANVPPQRAREAVTALEPPRARSAVIEPEVTVSLSRALPQAVGIEPRGEHVQFEPEHRVTPEDVPVVLEDEQEESPELDDATDAPETHPLSSASIADVASRSGPRRRTPAQTTRHISGSFPRTRTGEGTLPRAYVAKRRGGARGDTAIGIAVRAATPEAVEAIPDPPRAIPADLARALSGRVSRAVEPTAADPPPGAQQTPRGVNTPTRVMHRDELVDVPLLDRLRHPLVLFLAFLVIALAIFVLVAI